MDRFNRLSLECDCCQTVITVHHIFQTCDRQPLIFGHTFKVGNPAKKTYFLNTEVQTKCTRSWFI
uniref:Uncharacterized protein n=1 Tax=Anguilla anguilla TaxID=7936 RepID=A0A0E9S7G3_ANGAN